MPSGGRREGSGRKPLPENRKKLPVKFYLDKYEAEEVRAFILQMRARKNENR